MSIKKFQLIIFMISFTGVLLTIGKLIANPETSKKQVNEYQFPEKISLPEWNFIKSVKLNEKIDYELVLANQQYSYEKDKQKLEITTRYVVGTRGTYHGMINLEDKITNQNRNDLLLSIKQKDNLNYAMFIKEDKAYLVSCINARGGSTINSEQFMKNRYNYDINFKRFLPWLMGKESSIDLRCLWTYLSLPINKNSPEITYQTLEQAWFSWYNYWQNNYPHY
jgi:cyanosortase A-associated protein